MMKLDKIRNKIKKTKVSPIEINNYYSVLVPLVKIDGELHLVFEIRSLNIDRQPGEISFPGGQVELDETFKEAAVRETYEEIGIDKEKIEIISGLDYIVGKNNFFIYPYLGYLHDTKVKKLIYNKDEVSQLFTVPLEFFLQNEPKSHKIKYKPVMDDTFPTNMIQNGKNYNWGTIEYPVYFYKYNDYIIWGLTAKIIYNFIKKIK